MSRLLGTPPSSSLGGYGGADGRWGLIRLGREVGYDVWFADCVMSRVEAGVTLATPMLLEREGEVTAHAALPREWPSRYLHSALAGVEGLYLGVYVTLVMLQVMLLASSTFR